MAADTEYHLPHENAKVFIHQVQCWIAARVAEKAGYITIIERGDAGDMSAGMKFCYADSTDETEGMGTRVLP